MEAAVALNSNQFIVTIPRIDTRKFKGIIKALGWSAEKADTSYSREAFNARIKEADEDLKAGRCTRMLPNESGEEFVNRMLCATKYGHYN